jgi:membrane-bound ClpP family serine protease
MSEIGLLLLFVSAALAVAEAHVPTHGALGSAAVASLAAGIALVIAGAGVGTLLALTSGAAVAAPSTCGWSCTRRSPLGGRACAAAPRG